MVKTCETCGAAFETRRTAARFCSSRCFGDRIQVISKPDQTGRARARLMYPIQPCEVCSRQPAGRGSVERHHRNSDRLDNSPENIAFLCRKHHIAAHKSGDGRVGGGKPPHVIAAERSRMRRGAEEVARLMRSGLTQTETAARLGVRKSTVQRWTALHRDLFPPPRVGRPPKGWWAG